MFVDANRVYFDALSRLTGLGVEVDVRGHVTKELINQTYVVPIEYPEINIPERKLSSPFRSAEAWWILSGRNDLDFIKQYAPSIKRWSDDGYFMAGAYGPRVVDQIPYVLKCFKEDLSTRQAIISIWRSSPTKSLDIPCTLSLQFLVRDMPGKQGTVRELHCIANMRSSDAYLGLPYDLFTFSMIAIYIALLLKETKGVCDLTLGALHLNAASSHIYQRDENKIRQVIQHDPGLVRGSADYDLKAFDKPEELLWHLERNFR